MQFYKKPIFLPLTFYLFVVILLATRILLILNLNTDYIDSDMPFMWAGVKDYSEGLFYEPRFYGQDYNTFMECLFAVPLYWLGVPVYYALPIIAHIVAVFPFLFTAFYLFYKNRKKNAILVIAIFLCLAPGYDVMTSQPRGISGIFLCGFYILSFLNPTHMRFLALNTLLTVLAYFVTPNAVVVSVPLMTFLFFHNYKNKKYYIITVCCLLSSILFYLVFDKFYKDHPDYIIYGLNNSWAPGNFLYAIRHLDKSFGHVSFFIEEICATVLVAFTAIGFALFKKNKIAFLSFLSFLGVILLSFFASKVQEGVVWPFYSFSRMYIAIPFAIALFTVFFQVKSNFFFTSIIVITIAYSVFKFYNFKSSIRYHTEERRWNGVHLIPLQTVLNGCIAFKDICHKNDVNFFLISSTFWLSTYLNYGGEVIYEDFPKSQETMAERRYWVRQANANKIFKRFIFLSVNYDFDKSCEGNSAFRIKRLDDYGLMLIEDNTLSNKEFVSLTLNRE
ncbi:hypothetical protein [Aurantibacillus circumpalustris]|uniref:hypothetical protein n=1 Tax=Aurantibacillus circumpalustris TaxID=3036359 RepID=UPI00295B02FC|nr:hypothetical protein [Aurantibacillus circumpalustris]